MNSGSVSTQRHSDDLKVMLLELIGLPDEQWRQPATALIEEYREASVLNELGRQLVRPAWFRKDPLAHKNERLFDAQVEQRLQSVRAIIQRVATTTASGPGIAALSRRRIGRTELSAGPLTIGLNGALHIREERLSIRHDACRLMYVSDIHLRRTRSDNLCRQVIESARSSEIDVLLLGGDLVDGPAELGKLCDLVGALCEVAPVFAVGGNHDRHVGMNRVRDAVVSGGGQWIHAGAARVSHGSRVIAVSGPDAASLPEGDFQVLCATTRASGKRRVNMAMTWFWPGISMAVRWLRLSIETACFPERFSTRIVI